jgi:hypothetical protein
VNSCCRRAGLFAAGIIPGLLLGEYKTFKSIITGTAAINDMVKRAGVFDV